MTGMTAPGTMRLQRLVLENLFLRPCGVRAVLHIGGPATSFHMGCSENNGAPFDYVL